MVPIGNPGSVKIGKLYLVPINGLFGKGQSMKITISFTNPLKLPLPTGIASNTIYMM